MRSLMSKTPPIDNLAPLAKAGVPYSARLRESRPVAEEPDTGGGEAVQGTRREDHGAGGRG